MHTLAKPGPLVPSVVSRHSAGADRHALLTK